jgi:thiol-disulfide isomerase/thioredoxin
MHRSLPLAFVLLLSVLPFAAAQRVGDTLPDFRLSDGRGDAVAPVDLRGGPWLLNVWATWCPPCKAELPMLAAMADATGGSGLRVVLLDAGEPPSVAQAFLDGEGLDLETLVDPIGTDASDAGLERTLVVLRRLGVQGLPTTLVMDADGVVRGKWTGALSAQGLTQLLDRVGVAWTP